MDTSVIGIGPSCTHGTGFRATPKCLTFLAWGHGDVPYRPLCAPYPFSLCNLWVDKVIENVFVRDLGDTIQRYMGHRLGYDGSRGYTRWLLWYTAWTHHPCID